MSQLKEEVRLQYEKLHQLLDEDLRQTVEVLDKAQAKFCSENAAQALHLGERMQEAKKLLGSLQLLFDKTEDVSFMKVGWGRDRLLGPGLMPQLESAFLGSPASVSQQYVHRVLEPEPAWLQSPPTPALLSFVSWGVDHRYALYLGFLTNKMGLIRQSNLLSSIHNSKF